MFVESELGRGATFRLYFPVARPISADPPADTASPPHIMTVLIVDDESSIVNLISAALRSEGYQLLKAASGSEALKAVAAHGRPIDLVVTDRTMPGMSGPELVAALQVDQPNLRVILTSGDTHGLSELQGAGSSISMMQKPFTPKEVRARVRDALSRHQQ